MRESESAGGSWGPAIRSVLEQRRWTLANLIRRMRTSHFCQRHHCRPVQAKTIRRAARGLPVQTRTLALIAAALDISLDALLQAPVRPTEWPRVVSAALVRALDARYLTVGDLELLLQIRRQGPEFRRRLEMTLAANERRARRPRRANGH